MRGYARLVLAAICLLSVTLANARETGSKGRLIVAVAASAAPAMEDIARDFQTSTGVEVLVSSGATGLLARQAREGAPFDLFLSADMITVEKLAMDGIVTSESVATFALGELILWVSPHSRAKINQLEDLGSAEQTRLSIAMASPDTAPFGAAAREAVTNSGLWDRLSSHIIFSENVRQALQYAESGNCDAAFIPAALVPEKGRAITVSDKLYSPIRLGLGTISRTKNPQNARLLRDYILGADGRRILARHRHGLP